MITGMRTAAAIIATTVDSFPYSFIWTMKTATV